MRSKLAARVLAAALLAALLNVPAHAAPAPARPAHHAASWWDWLERLPRKIWMGWVSKAGAGADPNGLTLPEPPADSGRGGWDPNG